MKKQIGIFGIVPIDILQDNTLTVNQLRVYIAIASFQGNSDECNPSVEAIAKRAGLAKLRTDGRVNINATCKAIKELIEKGWVKRLGRQYGKTYRYTVLYPIIEEEAIDKPQASKPTAPEPTTGQQDPVDIVLQYWNSKGIIKHSVINRTVIARYVRIYGIDKIKEAIDNYATVLKSDDYFFKYKWTLRDFLKKGVEKFLSEADPLRNYLKDGRRKQTIEELYGKI